MTDGVWHSPAPCAASATRRISFTRMPSYTDPGLGPITECQWISSTAVQVLAEVPVTAANLPLTPRLHDHATVARRAARDPNGFPWLDQPAGPSQPLT